MIVDCHTHINSCADEDKCGEHFASIGTVDRCIVLADFCEDIEQSNKAVVEYVAKHKEKMVGFAFLDPTRDMLTSKKLASLTTKNGLSGVVLYNSRCGFHPAHSMAMNFYESAEQLGLPVFFHNDTFQNSDSILTYSEPMLLDEVARNFPELKIIVGNMGSPFVEQCIALVLKHKNVYADLTINVTHRWETYNTIVRSYESMVMNKLFFGSGFPAGTAGQSIEILLGFNKMLGDTNLPTVPRGEIRNIIERDTFSLLGIKQK